MVLNIVWLTTALAWLMISHVAANWDPATGHVRDYIPAPAWLQNNRPLVVSNDVQVAECAKNTRLHYPNVQLFALFRVDHSRDNHHGCPYGECLAFDVFPRPEDLVANFTDSHLFFWHNAGGVPGDGTNPIADPQTGAFGYEKSLSGKFQVGPPDVNDEQPNHDANYPGFHQDTLVVWTQQERDLFKYKLEQPSHPKCGHPCESNRDPGSDPGVYGNYKPADATDYKPPPTWQPTTNDTCFNNVTNGSGNATASGGNDYTTIPGVNSSNPVSSGGTNSLSPGQ